LPHEKTASADAKRQNKSRRQKAEAGRGIVEGLIVEIHENRLV
jgi:hypothetical protein